MKRLMSRSLLRWPRVALVVMVAFASGLAGEGAVLTSRDGQTREFAVVVSASPDGLTVREKAESAEVLIPWRRLDEDRTKAANPWFQEARAKAAAGETFKLNLAAGLPVAPATKPEGDWRTVKSTVNGAPGQGFGVLRLSAYVHREVPVPRLAVVWVGATSPLAQRGDAADLARRMQGALVVAEFDRPVSKAEDGSGEALVAGVADLLRQARVGGATASAPSTGKSGPLARPNASADAAPPRAPAEAAGDKADEPPKSGPAVILIGRDAAATFVWSLVCARPRDVVAAVTVDGVLKESSTAGAFATPCLFLESAGVSSRALGGREDLTRPLDLWRHFSTDGCRWCHAAPSGDPLALAVAFAREVATASPYVEALERLEHWENDPLRHRIPMPAATPKNFKEEAFRLARPDGSLVFPVAAKSGPARNDLVWVPSADFAARLAGK